MRNFIYTRLTLLPMQNVATPRHPLRGRYITPPPASPPNGARGVIFPDSSPTLSLWGARFFYSLSVSTGPFDSYGAPVGL